MRKLFVTFCLIIFGSSIALAQTQEPRTLYLSELGNIPLMPTASVISGASTVFDKPSGRIAEVQLLSQQSPEELMNYYNKALPPLGWEKQTISTFIREQEELSFKTLQDNGQTIAVIRLTPVK